MLVRIFLMRCRCDIPVILILHCSRDSDGFLAYCEVFLRLELDRLKCLITFGRF